MIDWFSFLSTYIAHDWLTGWHVNWLLCFFPLSTHITQKNFYNIESWVLCLNWLTADFKSEDAMNISRICSHTLGSNRWPDSIEAIYQTQWLLGQSDISHSSHIICTLKTPAHTGYFRQLHFIKITDLSPAFNLGDPPWQWGWQVGRGLSQLCVCSGMVSLVSD